MANRGVDLERAGRLAKEIRSTKEAVRAEMPQELDIEGLLRWEHENIIINAIEEVKVDTLKKVRIHSRSVKTPRGATQIVQSTDEQLGG